MSYMPTRKSFECQMTIDAFVREVSGIPGEHPVVFDFGGEPGSFLVCRNTNQLRLGMFGEGDVHGVQRRPTKHSLLSSAKVAAHDIFPGVGEFLQASPDTPLWAESRAVIGVELNRGRCVVLTQELA